MSRVLETRDSGSEVPNPGQAKSDSDSNSNKLLEPFLQQGKPSASPQSEWTVAVDLAILFDAKGTNGHLGAESKAKMLEQLKDKTKNSPVTIVVQVLSVPDESTSAGVKISDSKAPYQVTRITLKNGQEIDGPTVPSKGVAGDFADLMDYAAAQPSAKLAVAINAHGEGDEGVAGGMEENPRRVNQRISPIEISNILETALTKNNRGKADVFDYDSCLMAETGVLDAMSHSTKQLVASEVQENASTSANGQYTDAQNLNAWISALIADPKMDGAQLANTIVDKAKAGANKTVFSNGNIRDGTDTLTQFDMDHYAEFKAHLDNLGDALVAAENNPNNKTAIAYAIDRTPDIRQFSNIGPHIENDQVAKRDLVTFLKTLKLQLSSKQYQDADHRLANAVDEMSSFLADPTKLIANTHGKVTNGTNTLNGLSVFLPDLQIRTSPYVSEEQLRNLYTDAAGTENSGWKKFLESLRTPRPLTILDR